MFGICRRKAQKGTIPLKPKQDLRYIIVGWLEHTWGWHWEGDYYTTYSRAEWCGTIRLWNLSLWVDDVTMSDVEELMDPIYPPEPSSSRKRPSWLSGILDDAERHATPRGTFHERKKPNRYQGYLTSMSTIIQNEPSSFSNDVKHQVWKDAMTIMENDVWEVVPRPQDKTIVTSKWIYKIKLQQMEVWNSIRLILLLVVSPRRKV